MRNNKEILVNFRLTNDVNIGIGQKYICNEGYNLLIIRNKKGRCKPAFFPKSYHELNLLMLWFFKNRAWSSVWRRYPLKVLIFSWTTPLCRFLHTKCVLCKKGVGLKIKRRSMAPSFSPNLTMNLTYLCYGFVKVMA